MNIDLQPSGPIFRTEGDTIEIPCTLDNTENYTIDDLELHYNRQSLRGSFSEVIVIIFSVCFILFWAISVCHCYNTHDSMAFCLFRQ